MRAADVAEALGELPPDAAPRRSSPRCRSISPCRCSTSRSSTRRRVEIIQAMDAGDAAAPLIEAMSADQQADLFRELPESERARAARRRSTRRRAHALELLLRYPPGHRRRHHDDRVRLRSRDWTVEQALDHIARGRALRKETVYAIYCLDPKDALSSHVVSLRDLMLAPTARETVARRRQPAHAADASRRAPTARRWRALISKYNLLAVPVVDEASARPRHRHGRRRDRRDRARADGGRAEVRRYGGARRAVHGDRLRHDDQEARAAGSARSSSPRCSRRRRCSTSRARSRSAVVLAMFIPLVMSSGGNSGSQATSLIIRALALREIRLGDWWRIALRELPTGLTLGAILGVIGFVRIALWQALGICSTTARTTRSSRSPSALALVGIVGFGSLAGSMLPFLLDALGFDPASASAPFVATLVDVTGLVIYFSVAFVICAERCCSRGAFSIISRVVSEVLREVARRPPSVRGLHGEPARGGSVRRSHAGAAQRRSLESGAVANSDIAEGRAPVIRRA